MPSSASASSTLLDPKNDAVFKMLFARTPHLLADLINAVRGDAPPIDVIEVINPGITPDELAGKFIVLDVLARDPSGQAFEVEMQV
nr:PD-(D/E)XK nuclease family transposase [Zoogloeaceae bacterium]